MTAVAPSRVTQLRNRAIGLGAFLLFAGLWTAFAIALVAAPARLDEAWSWLTGLPLVLQAVVWLVLLPLTGGLWVWETDWPLALRLVVVAGLAGWTLYMFLPRWLLASRTGRAA